jgi:hypothetical protein
MWDEIERNETREWLRIIVQMRAILMLRGGANEALNMRVGLRWRSRVG